MDYVYLKTKTSLAAEGCTHKSPHRKLIIILLPMKDGFAIDSYPQLCQNITMIKIVIGIESKSWLMRVNNYIVFTVATS